MVRREITKNYFKRNFWKDFLAFFAIISSLSYENENENLGFNAFDIIRKI